MACGGCVKRRAAAAAARKVKSENDLMGGYANLTANQINARLESYKRRYCTACAERYECDYENYLKCKKSEQN